MFSDYVSKLLLSFVFFSFIGWVIVNLIETVKKRKLTLKSFFQLPLKPTIGLCSVVIQQCYNQVNIVILIILSFILLVALEYLSSYLTEKITNFRLWDYGNKPYNLNGRVSIFNVLVSLVLAFLIFGIFNDEVMELIYRLQAVKSFQAFVTILLGIIILDVFATLSTLLGKSKELIEGKNLITKYKKLKETTKVTFSVIEKALSNENQKISNIASKLMEIIKNISEDRNKAINLVTIDAEGLREVNQLVKEYLENSHKETKRKRNSQKIRETLYLLFWVFVIGCIVGYVSEALWCFFKRGYFESRQGLIYGPFNQVYGIGAVMLTIILTKVENKSNKWIFITSFIAGGLFEAVVSYFQELIFQTVSWNYPKAYFGILGGRSNLIYMLFWGVLGLVFIKKILPSIRTFIKNFPPQAGRIITYILGTFFILNISISGIAVYRWQERIDKVEATNKFEIFIDKHFPDEFMKSIYPNMYRKKD